MRNTALECPSGGVPSKVSFKRTKCDKVSSEVPFVWIYHDKVPFMWTKWDKVASRVPFNLTKHDKVPF